MADRALIPAASAAGISAQPSSSIRLTSRRRLSGQVRALAWSFIRVLWNGETEADDGGRTRDLKLGKLALYQLSYVRACGDSSSERGKSARRG
jgi:hypothetical protein